MCDKAFARRDKLVIHMNKMKHRTPTNVAPLGKRSADKPASKKEEEEAPNNKPCTNLQTAAANWSCELCGQMMTTREEWMVHAKAHLEEKITGIGVSTMFRGNPSFTSLTINPSEVSKIIQGNNNKQFNEISLASSKYRFYSVVYYYYVPTSYTLSFKHLKKSLKMQAKQKGEENQKNGLHLNSGKKSRTLP